MVYASDFDTLVCTFISCLECKRKTYANSTTLICFRIVYLYRQEIKCIVKMPLPLWRLVLRVRPTIQGDHFSDLK